MGMVKLALKEDDAAFANFEKSNTILEDKRGIDHLSTSNSIWYMGSIYERKGDNEKALRCYESCIRGRLKCLGESHLDVAECLYRMVCYTFLLLNHSIPNIDIIIRAKCN